MPLKEGYKRAWSSWNQNFQGQRKNCVILKKGQRKCLRHMQDRIAILTEKPHIDVKDISNIFSKRSSCKEPNDFLTLEK